jgi:hypothetical protein
MSDLEAELTRLRERNNDSNYHQNQKAKEIIRLKGEVTIREAELARLREENEKLQDALRRIAEAAAHWVESSRQMEHRARQALEEKS